MANDFPDDPVPPGALTSPVFQDIPLLSAVSQNGAVVNCGPDVLALMQVGDEIIWPGIPASAVIYQLESTFAKAFPSQVISSSTAYLHRDLTVFDPPRALLTENPIWKYKYGGYFAPFEYAKKLVLRVSDGQVDDYVRTIGDGSTLAFVADHGSIGNTENFDFSVTTLVPQYVITMSGTFTPGGTTITLHNNTASSFLGSRVTMTSSKSGFVFPGSGTVLAGTSSSILVITYPYPGVDFGNGFIVTFKIDGVTLAVFNDVNGMNFDVTVNY